MKKSITWINLFVFTIIVCCSSYPIFAESNVPDEVRIGLRQYFEKKDVINVENYSLTMGYIVKNKWEVEYSFNSNNGFTFKPATYYYLISEQVFGSFEEASNKVNILREQGYHAYVGSASRGIWKIYVGNATTNDGAVKILNAINNVNNLSYQIFKDNGYRTIMEYSGGYPLIIENTYQHPEFITLDDTYSAPVINLGKRKYRGRMEFGRYNESGITAINIIKLDQYLYGVLPSEMIPTWPLEALKAQAVAARNYAVYYSQVINKYPKKPYDLDDTINSQVYKGFGVEHPKCNQAINETTDELIYFGDKIIPSYFFSTSGGHTENSENVWSGTVPYLKGVPDIYETEPEKEPWLVELTGAKIKEKLAKYDINIGNVLDVIPLGYTEANRVMELKIVGTSGEHTIKKETIRTWLGLRSRKFKLIKENYAPQQQYSVMGADRQVKEVNLNNIYMMDSSYNAKLVSSVEDQFIVVSKYNIENIPIITGKKNTYIFAGEGWGHGVGMSQSGAKGMALNGYTYKEILEYYYTGTKVR